MKRETESVIGKKIGELIIREEYSVKNKDHTGSRIFCICECSCGNKIIIRKDYFKRIKLENCHCGCLNKNTFEIKTNYVVGYTLKKEEFYIDLEDLDDVKNHLWCFDGEYISTNLYTDKKIIHLRLHTFILYRYNISKNQFLVDHKNLNKKDNRRENLRECNHSQNMQNRPVSKRNKSGILGVFIPKDGKSWHARITLNGNIILLGTYIKFKDAVRARLFGEKKYFGEFAPQKHLFEKYGVY